MRAVDGPLTIFVAGVGRLVRAAIPAAMLFVLAALATALAGQAMPLGLYDLFTDSGGPHWSNLVIFVTLLLSSSFLAGGVLVRYARPERRGVATFLADCRAFAGRMLRLSLLGLASYELVTLVGDPMPADGAFDLRSEAVFVMALAVQIFIQLAVIRTVADDRRSVFFALAAGWRLLVARPFTVLILGVFSMIMISVLLPVGLLAVVLGVTGSALQVDLFFGDQLVSAIAIALDLLLAAALMALYQSEMRRSPERDGAAAPSGLPGLDALTVKE